MYQARNGQNHVPWGLFVALASALLALPPAWGQTDTARLQGTVVDVTGASVGGATVTLTNLGTNRVVTAETDPTDGSYSIPALPVGRYRIEVEKQNFKPVTREVTLQISQVAAVNFTLALGTVSEAVTVTAEAALVDSANSAMGDVVQSRPVTELPLNGRNFTQLATLIPGVTRGVPDGQATGAQGNAETFRYGNTGGAALSVNGLRPQANNFVLDGVDNNESLVNTVVFFPPAEAIEEFRVQTSIAPAEFGRAGGAIVNTAIKSGTNEYHGSAFEFLRNSQLDARPTFAPQRNPFRRNQFGGTLGGPLVRNKLFVFSDYQGLRQFQPKSTDFATVPTAEFRNGNFSQLLNPELSGLSQPIAIRDLTTGQPFSGNIIPQSRLNPAGQKYLNAFPLPNTNGGKVTQNYVTQRNETQSFNDFDIRTDWNIRESDQLFGRFSYGEADQSVSSRLPALPAGFGSGTNFSRTRGIVLGETHTFSPNLINEFRLGFARIFFAYTPPFQDKTISADLGIPNANTSSLLGGGALIGGYNNQLEYTGDYGPYLVPQNTYQIANTATYIRGPHTLRFGGNIIRRQVNLFRPNRGKGYFFLFGNGEGAGSTGFESADVLAGFVKEYSIGPPFGMVGTRNWETGYFVQDDWRLSRKLTLNLGLRYDLYTFPSEANNRQANFDIVTRQLRVAGQDGNPGSLINTDKNNFAPRVGFAYDLQGDGKMVVRGGYGVFYFLDRGGIDNQLAQNPPFSGFSLFQFNDGARITLSGRGPDGTGPAGAFDWQQATRALPTGSTAGLNLQNPKDITVFAALPNNRNSYVQQWNLQVQRQVGAANVFSLAYVGTAGKRLTSYYNLNRQAFNAPAGTRQFPQLGGVNVQETRGSSIYNSLQAQLERRFTKGLQFRAAYTWSHAIDDTNGAFDARQPVDIRNFRLDRGSSSFDTRHRLVVSSLYEVPYGRGRTFGTSLPAPLEHMLGGWQINGILTFQSGFPFDLTTPGDPGDVRPDVVGPIQINSDNPDRYFNTQAFARVPTNTGGVLLRPGTLGRNALVGPGTRQLDFSVFKNFPLTERIKTQFRTEVFNLTNTPQFGQPNGDITSANFGRIQSTRFASERQIQFALRLSF